MLFKMGPRKTTPRIMKITVNNRPTAERIIPAVARPFPTDFRPRMPRTRPTRPMGPPQNQPTEAHKERIPRMSEAMARPLLLLTGAGTETGSGTGAGYGAG